MKSYTDRGIAGMKGEHSEYYVIALSHTIQLLLPMSSLLLLPGPLTPSFTMFHVYLVIDD